MIITVGLKLPWPEVSEQAVPASAGLPGRAAVFASKPSPCFAAEGFPMSCLGQSPLPSAI